MKNVIDCDGIFEILTRAPFPTGGAQDEDVESHLRVCHDCRCLAEALRPAVGLFHESLEDGDSLPQYNADRLTSKHGTGNGRWMRSLRAAVVAGLAAGVLMWLTATGGFHGLSPVGQRPVSQAAAPDAAGFLRLSALQLPSSCRAHRERLSPAQLPVAQLEQGWEFRCCTHCHRAGGAGPVSARSLRAFEVACATCHRAVES